MTATGIVYRAIMNIVAATLVADFLRAEVAAGREKIPKLKTEQRNMKRVALNKYGLTVTVRLFNSQDIAKISDIGKKYQAIDDKIEFIEENFATLATLELAIQHDNVEYMIALEKRSGY